MSSSPTSPPDLVPSKWNPYVISLVGTICTVFLFFSYYRILKRHCFSFGGAPVFANRIQRRLLNESNPDDPSLQFHSRGLDSSILYSLPAIQYRKKSDGEISQGDTVCAVCLGEFVEGEWLRFLPNCTHSFHISCIDTWFQSHSNCPLCRSHVVYNVTGHPGYSVSMFSLLETLRREDAILRENASRHHVLQTEAMQNSTVRQGPTNANQLNPGLDDSARNVDSSNVPGNNRRNVEGQHMGVGASIEEIQEPP